MEPLQLHLLPQQPAVIDRVSCRVPEDFLQRRVVVLPGFAQHGYLIDGSPGQMQPANGLKDPPGGKLVEVLCGYQGHHLTHALRLVEHGVEDGVLEKYRIHHVTSGSGAQPPGRPWDPGGLLGTSVHRWWFSQVEA